MTRPTPAIGAGRKEGLRTPEVRLACALSVAIAAVRLLLARPLRFCGTPDACYYLGLGQTLGAGAGFHARFVYDFQQAHLGLPNTGIEYWRPGISLVLQLLRPWGITLGSSIALTIAVGIVFAAAAWHLAMQTFGNRRFALGAFALCLVSTPVWGGSLTPDSGLYYGAAVAWFLALFTVRRQGLRQDVAALLCVGAAYLIRNDAALLLLPLLAVLWRRHRLAHPATIETSAGGTPRYAALMLCGFVLALVPMHLLYRSVLGTTFPSGAAQAFFLNDLSDFVRYNQPVSLHTLLGHGLKHLLVFRITTFATALYRIAALVIGYPALIFLPGLLFPAAPVAAAARPRSNARQTAATLPELTGPGTFFLVMLAVYTVLLPAVGGFSILRSVVGVFPVLVVLVLVGVGQVARTPRIAAALTAALVLVYAVNGLMDTRRAVEAANLIGNTDRTAAQVLASLGATASTAVILTPDPVQFSVTTGYAAVALPINGLDAIAAAAHDLEATHVILNTDDMPASPDELNRRLQPLHSEALPAAHLLILSLPASARALPTAGTGSDH